MWHISVELGSSVQLHIAEFYLEGHGGTDTCPYDFLAVYGGPGQSSPLLSKLCNRHAQNTTITSQGNNMVLVFRRVTGVLLK